MSENQGGDVLARGGIRAQFRAAGSSVTQEKWDSIWAEEKVEPKPAEPVQEPVQEIESKEKLKPVESETTGKLLTLQTSNEHELRLLRDSLSD
jgi:hypothetical protein